MNTAINATSVLAVALGGAIGSVLRYLVGIGASRWALGFPVGTLTVNIVGSFVIGVLLRTTGEGSTARAALAIGLCGGFTTFSAFSAEVMLLLQQSRTGRAAAYVAASVLLGLLATILGYAVAPKR